MEVLFPVSLYFRSAWTFILDGYLCGTCIVGFINKVYWLCFYGGFDIATVEFVKS
jgi:hypothetical protein